MPFLAVEIAVDIAVAEGFGFSLQGVRLVYDLFQKPISSLIIDLGQKFLLVSANHGLPFYLRYGLKLLMSKYESVRGSPILYEQGHWLTAN